MKRLRLLAMLLIFWGCNTEPVITVDDLTGSYALKLVVDKSETNKEMLRAISARHTFLTYGDSDFSIDFNKDSTFTMELSIDYKGKFWIKKDKIFLQTQSPGNEIREYKILEQTPKLVLKNDGIIYYLTKK